MSAKNLNPDITQRIHTSNQSARMNRWTVMQLVPCGFSRSIYQCFACTVQSALIDWSRTEQNYNHAFGHSIVRDMD